MSLPPPQTILITGASGELGQALALYYAAPDIHLLLQGRQQDKLEDLATRCRLREAKVTVVILELTDIAALQHWVNHSLSLDIPDLVIANAGMNINHGTAQRGEQWAEIDALLDVNIKATFALVNALVPLFRARGQGQLALISSLAAYYGLPVTPSYCASKAAIKVYGEAMRGWLAEDGIQINVVMPGYIDSSMAAAMPGPKLFMISADTAAQRIAQGLAKNHARITFPFPLTLGTWWLMVLPASWSQLILKTLHYGG